MLAGDGSAEALFCDNETNRERLWGVAERDAVPEGRDQRPRRRRAATVNPEQTGTKAALRYRLEVGAGETATIELRLSESRRPRRRLRRGHAQRAQAEADEFYAELTPAGASADEALVLRQALAGMLWSKQFYHYDIRRWLAGDPAGPPPPESRLGGRNHDWTHLDNLDVISMPDTWEYPWYAAWDLAFHCVALAHVDPEFAKEQLILLCREWYMHPNGQLPAYEWSFGDVNPPVHAWAALRVYEIAGDQDTDFLERVFHKLLLNFTWWVNRKDSEGNNVFEGGFLGLDNIGAFDRSSLPIGGRLEQSDGTAWMAMYCQNMLELALLLADRDPTYEDMATKFFEHFALIASALNDKGLWSEEDGFYYDVLHTGDGRVFPLRARSVVGLLPLAAVTTLGPATLARLPDFAARLEWFTANRPEAQAVVQHTESGRPPRLADALDRRPGAAAAASRRDARPGRVPLGSRPARALEDPRGASARGLDRRLQRDARLRAGRVAQRPVRRQLELAGAGLVSDQLPARSRRCASTTATSAMPSRSSSRPARGGSCSLVGGRGRARRAPDGRSSSRRPDGTRPVFGELRAAPARPGLERADPVPRVLPRRHRRRARRLAPDRLDRARRRPDHPPRTRLRAI